MTADAGVVDEDVEPAVAVERGLYGCVPVVGAGDVEVDVCCVAAELGNLRFGLPAFVIEDVADDDLRAFIRANRTASAAPCPRAPPLMSATLPSSRAMMDLRGVFSWEIDIDGQDGEDSFFDTLTLSLRERGH